MAKQYIRIHDVLDSEIRKLQGTLIRTFVVDVSFNTVVNMVLLAGLLAAEKLDKADWALIKDYWQKQEGVQVPVGGAADLITGQIEAA